MVDKQIKLTVSAVDNMTGPLSRMGGSLKNFAEKNKTLFTGMAAAGTAAFAGIIGIAKTSIDAFGESQAQLVRVDTILKNINTKKMGSSFDEAAQKARDFGTKLQKLAGIGDELGAESFAKLLSITKDYGKATQYTTIAADLAVAKQMDMGSATKIVAMALAGNTRILKEYGIEVRDNATQTEIMGKIQEKVGGQATAFGKTMQGQQAILKETFGDMQEAIGGALVPALSQLLSKIQPIIEKITDWATKNPELVSKILLVSGAIAGLVAAIGTLGLILPAIVTGVGALMSPLALVLAAIGLLAAAWYKNWGGIRDTVNSVINYIKPEVQEFLANLKGFWDKYGADIINVLKAVGSLVMSIVKATFTVVGTIFKNFFALLNAIADIFRGDWHGAWQKFKEIAVNSMKALNDVLTELFGQIRTDIKHIFTQMRDDAKEWGANLVTNLTDGIKSKWSDLKDSVANLGETISDYIGFHSPSKKGAGKDADKWMPNLIAMLAGGLYDGEGVISAAAAKIGNSIYKSLTKDQMEKVKEYVKSVQSEALSMFDSINSSLSTHRDTIKSLKQEYKDLTKQIADVGKEIANIKNTGAQQVAARAVAIQDELAQIKKDMPNAADDSAKAELAARQKQLEIELQIAQANTTQAQLTEARRQAGLTETQKIIETTAQQVKDKEAEKVELEKQRQAKLKAIIDEKEQYKTLVESKRQLDEQYFAFFNEQINAQQRSIKDTIAMLQSLNSAASGKVASSTTAVSGKRAFGGTIMGGQAYLVGEDGPEIVVPSSTQKVMPNVSGGSMAVSINLGGVTVRSEADINALVQKIKVELINEAKRFNLGVLV